MNPRSTNAADADVAGVRSALRTFWIVIVGYNGLDDTLQCLASIAAIDSGPPNCVYVDNASAGDAADAVKQSFPWCHVVRNPVNEGYAGGNNRGIEYALARGADRLLILNNDTIVHPELPLRLVTASLAYPEIGVIGPVIGFIGDPDVVMTDACLFNRKDRREFFSRQVVPTDPDRQAVVGTDIVNGCCMLLRADMINAVGAFNEQFFLVHEESELCFRGRAAGFGVGVLNQMLVWHKGSSSFKRTGRRLQKYFDIRNLPHLLRIHRPFGGTRRSAARTWLAYVRYAYHIFCVEHEAREEPAATAVLEGLVDALARRTGPYEARRRTLVRPLRHAFLTARSIAGIKQSMKPRSEVS